jgi:nitrate reductase molybdenum cofactor assembly chaperone NarJ/NarW
MAVTFKALGALLDYPRAELIGAVPEIRARVAAEGLLASDTRGALEPLLLELVRSEPMALEERYVDLFDRTRSLSLHLYEHVHGESRDRGQAMVALGSVYERHGYAPTATELPDFLPLFCEFLSLLPVREARALLGQAVNVLEALRARLERRESVYAPVVSALVELADADADPELLDALLRESGADETSFEAIDAAWEDAPVTFGPEPAAGRGVPVAFGATPAGGGCRVAPRRT